VRTKLLQSRAEVVLGCRQSTTNNTDCPLGMTAWKNGDGWWRIATIVVDHNHDGTESYVPEDVQLVQRVENVETMILLVQDETLSVLNMKNVPSLYNHLVLDAPAVFAVIQATIELPVHETRTQGEVYESSIGIDICIFRFM
jgi:hypothetical protein